MGVEEAKRRRGRKRGRGGERRRGGKRGREEERRGRKRGRGGERGRGREKRKEERERKREGRQGEKMQFVNCPNMDTLLSRWDDALPKSTAFTDYTAEQAGALAIPIQKSH